MDEKLVRVPLASHFVPRQSSPLCVQKVNYHLSWSLSAIWVQTPSLTPRYQNSVLHLLSRGRPILWALSWSLPQQYVLVSINVFHSHHVHRRLLFTFFGMEVVSPYIRRGAEWASLDWAVRGTPSSTISVQPEQALVFARNLSRHSNKKRAKID